MTPPRVLITATGYRERCSQGWNALIEAGIEIIETPYDRPLVHSEIAELMRGVEGAIVGVDPWDARAFDISPDLVVLARFGVGVDNIDIVEARRRGIVVQNVPGGNAASVAELTVLHMLAQLRELVPVAEATQGAVWSRPLGRDLHAEVVGLVGFGDIGRRVAGIVSAFGSRVVAFDPFADPEEARRLGVGLCSLEELQASATVISLHLPSLPETRHLVDRAFLEKLRPEAIIVNTARGALVDSKALAAAVRSGRIAGAAVDVFEEEPITPADPLLGDHRILATPHIAAETIDTYERIGLVTARIVIDALSRPRAAARAGGRVRSE